MKLDDICDRRRVEVLDAANRRSLVRMRAERFLIERVEEASIRRREHTLAKLFLHHRAL